MREHGTKETLHSVKTRTTSQSNRIEADDADDRMLDPVAGTPATEKPWQELLIFLLMISLEQVELKWNNVSWLDSEMISKFALKSEMM